MEKGCLFCFNLLNPLTYCHHIPYVDNDSTNRPRGKMNSTTVVGGDGFLEGCFSIFPNKLSKEAPTFNAFFQKSPITFNSHQTLYTQENTNLVFKVLKLLLPWTNYKGCVVL